MPPRVTLEVTPQTNGYNIDPHSHTSGFFLRMPYNPGEVDGRTNIDARVVSIDCQVYYPGLPSGYYMNFLPVFLFATAPNCFPIAKHYGPPGNITVDIINVSQNPNSSGDYILPQVILGDLFVYKDFKCHLKNNP